MKIIKLIALSTVALLAIGALTGCKDAQRQLNYTEEELPYGSTMRCSKDGYAVPITYDRRFLNEDQVTVIANYLSAIQDKDGALYKESTLDFYADYQINEVYSEAYDTLDEMVSAINAAVAASSGEDFSFSMVIVSDLTEEAKASGISDMLTMMENINPDDNFRDTVESCYALELEWSLEFEGGTARSEDNRIYLLGVDGKYYCVM